MKRNFIRINMLVTAMAAVFNVFGQTGVTKYGTGALSSNTVSGIYNTGIGYYSLNANTTGNKNTAVGGNTLRFTTTGIFNTATGYAAMYQNTTGNENTAYGLYSLFSNTIGSFNTAYGTYSLQATSNGSANTAVGYKSLYRNNGYQNTAVGYNALYSNTATNNTGVGADALMDNQTGSSNTAIGVYALMRNTSGSNNTASGFNSLFFNNGSGNAGYGIFSLYNNVAGHYNAAQGYYSLYTNSSGSYNTATGTLSVYLNQNGSFNAGHGYLSLFNNTTGWYNTASGAYALQTNTTGSYNTAVGNGADVTTGTLTNATALGAGATVDRSNKVRIGNTAVTSIGGQVGWTIFSDGRFKKNISEDIPGLDFINSLRPVSYTLDTKAINAVYKKNQRSSNYDSMKVKEDSQTKSLFEKANDEASKLSYTGFVAQEVEAAAKKLNFDFSGVDKPETADGLYGLRYDNFIAPLVKAVQELAKQNTELKKEIDMMKAEMHNTVKNNVSITDASIDQNAPNPFSGSTVINYSLPLQVASAKIIIADKAGKTLKQLDINRGGKGSVTVQSALLSSGAYSYSLYVNGQLISTKQMLLAK